MKRATTATDGDVGLWSAPGHAVSIEYPLRLLDEIRAEAVDGIHRLRHGGIEIGGVLFGSREGDRIRILNWRPLHCEYAQGPSFVLSENDEAALETLMSQASVDPELSSLTPVGWYHSHTRSGVFLSESDMAIYNRHFPEPWQIALVLRPTQLGPAEVGFFFREPDGNVHKESGYNSFTVYPLASAERPVSVRQGAPDLQLEPIGPSSFGRPSPAPGSEKPPQQRWLWLMAAIFLGVLGIGVLSNILHIGGPPSSRPTISLRASDEGGQVRIEWDKSAEPIVSARNASVLVVDGDRKLETALSPELLHNGNLVYQRKSPDVEIRLRVSGADSDPVQELTRLIGLSPAPAVPVERHAAADRTEPSPSKETDQLKRAATSKRMPAASKGQARPQSPKLPETLATPPPEIAPEIPSQRVTAAALAPIGEPPRIPAPKASSVYRGPTTGRLIWTGNLAPRSTLQINGDHASLGDITGKLPSAPVRLHVYPASFSRAGIDVFARELGRKEIREAPSPANGWMKTVYKRNPKRAGDVVLTESPSAGNDWKRIGLRAGDHAVSVIVIDWEVLPNEHLSQHASSRMLPRR